MPRCSHTRKLTWSLNFYKGAPTKCNKIVILPDFNNQTSYLISVIFFVLQNLNINLEVAPAKIFSSFCCCFHCVWMSKSENLQGVLVWQLCCNRADFTGWSTTVQTHHSQTPCSRFDLYHHNHRHRHLFQSSCENVRKNLSAVEWLQGECQFCFWETSRW